MNPSASAGKTLDRRPAQGGKCDHLVGLDPFHALEGKDAALVPMCSPARPQGDPQIAEDVADRGGRGRSERFQRLGLRSHQGEVHAGDPPLADAARG
jgi:hypothetical protein